MISQNQKERSCRLCGSNGLRLLYTQGNADEFCFYRCLRCGLVNYDLAAGLDQGKYAKAFIDPRDERHPVNAAQTQTFRFLRSRAPEPGRLLEIGCGNGRLLMLARNEGWSVRGIELSPFLAESVRNLLGIEVDVTDFLTYRPDSRDCYDVVVMRHVLEHLPDGRAAMTSIHRMLKAEGRALLEFPNIDAWDLRFKRLLRRLRIHRKQYPPDYRPGHCNEYNRRSFEYLLRETGFHLIEWQTYAYGPIADWVFNRVAVGNKARAWARKATTSAPDVRGTA